MRGNDLREAQVRNGEDRFAHIVCGAINSDVKGMS